MKKKITEHEELILSFVLPFIYLYSQIILKLDKGLFGLIPICIGEILLALIVQQHNNKVKTFISS